MHKGSCSVDEVAWYQDNAGSTTHAVKRTLDGGDQCLGALRYEWSRVGICLGLGIRHEYWFDTQITIPGGVTDKDVPNQIRALVGHTSKARRFARPKRVVRVAER